MNGLIIRPYRAEDAADLAALFHRAVQEGAARLYSATERNAWSPEPPNGGKWQDRLAEADTIVAEHDGKIAGFMTLDASAGFVDFAYVAPEVMGKGVAEVLYAVVEGRARAAGCATLETEASKLAERFFQRRGWEVVAHQTVERGGVDIPNARMQKRLAPVKEVAA